jgi:hypothetical protein
MAVGAGMLAVVQGATVDTTFTNVSGSSWGNSANWSAGDVPNNGVNSYDVSIGDGSTISDMGTASTDITSFATLGNATFQGSFSGQTLAVEGAFSVPSGTLVINGALAMIMNGTTTIGGQVALQNGAGFENNGNLTVNTANTFAYQSATAAPLFAGIYNVLNNGNATWNNQNNVQFANYVVGNAGTMVLNLSSGNSFIAGTYDQSQSSGLTIVGSGATLQANQMNLTAGEVFGTGTYSGSNFVLGNGSNAGATVSPGAGPNLAGSLSLLGNFNTIGGATFAFDLGGTSQGSTYDELSFGNNVNFNNTNLTFNLINGYVPTSGDVFTIVTGTGSVSGMFADVSNGTITMSGVGTFNVSVGSGAVTLSNFSAVPEPGLGALVGGAGVFAGVVWRRRRVAR